MRFLNLEIARLRFLNLEIARKKCSNCIPYQRLQEAERGDIESIIKIINNKN